ncbi:hypothetical protein [Ensifer sp. LBL]|uniref:hypothetical protein n=1 Tax=Ensifer sp. LBL TaxID=2991056 RepID=UPI003D25145C
MADTANIVYRDFVTYGVPSSGKNKPKKDEIRRLLTGYEAIISAFTSNGGLIYASKAAMDADLARPANSMAWVLGDAIVANNGIYRKVGGVGTGSWSRAADLPFSFITANDVGAGTANDIQATTSIPVSASALVWMNVFEANTASPVTVSFNGGAPLTIKTNTGNNVAAGGLVSGMIILGIVSGSTFRLLNDQVSSAIVAAAEAAQVASEAAATSAANSAAAAAASAASVNLPASLTANTMLVTNPGATAREDKSFADVIALLGLDARYLRLTSRGYVDLSTDFGAPSAGSDFTNPWSQFLDACLFDAMKGEIPQGTFNISQPMSRTCTAPFQSLTIEGKGRQTLLNFRGEINAGLTVNYLTVLNCVNISRMNIQTDSQSGALSAFRLICPAHPDPAAAEYNIFDDVVFKGIDGYKTAKHFGTCVYSFRVNNMNFERCRFYGPGAAIGDGNGRGNQVELQSQNGDYAVKYVFEKCYFSQFQNAILVGPYVQGLVLDGSDFVGGRAAVMVPAGQLANDGLLVTGCHMNTREVGIEVLATEATSMEVNNTFFIIDKANQVGIRTAGYRWSVQNTHFEGQGSMPGSAGIHVISGAHHGIISGNQYGYMPSGNVLNSGCHDIKVLNNSYDNVVTPNVNNGTNNAIGIATA